MCIQEPENYNMSVPGFSVTQMLLELQPLKCSPVGGLFCTDEQYPKLHDEQKKIRDSESKYHWGYYRKQNKKRKKKL
jgi:hypothetical protein